MDANMLNKPSESSSDPIKLPPSDLSEDSRKRALSLPIIIPISPHPTITPSASFTVPTPYSKEEHDADKSTPPSPDIPGKKLE
jgi:hypothetical protein